MDVAEPWHMCEQRVRAHLEARQNEDAAKTVLESVGPEILGWLCGVFLDDDAAREVYTAFEAELPRELWTFREQTSFKCWLYGLARRVAFRRLRSPSSQEVPLGASLPPPREGETDTRTWAKTELSPSAFTRLRARLDPEERMVLILRVDRRMKWDEVARVMENPSTPATLRESAERLRRYFHRVRDRLRIMAVEEGLLSGQG